MSLDVIWGTGTQRLGFAVLVSDHFTGQRVEQSLEVSLDGRPEQPVQAASGGTRHPDGSYRFLALPDGSYTLLVIDPDGRWTIDGSPFPLALPLPDPPVLALQARPTPRWSAAPGQTVVRARIEKAGAPVAGAVVEIDVSTGPFAHSTTTDPDGECVHPVPGALPIEADGRVTLTVRVPGESVASITVDGVVTAGSQLTAQPGRSTRARVALNP